MAQVRLLLGTFDEDEKLELRFIVCIEDVIKEYDGVS